MAGRPPILRSITKMAEMQGCSTDRISTAIAKLGIEPFKIEASGAKLFTTMQFRQIQKALN